MRRSVILLALLLGLSSCGEEGPSPYKVEKEQKRRALRSFAVDHGASHDWGLPDVPTTLDIQDALEGHTVAVRAWISDVERTTTGYMMRTEQVYPPGIAFRTPVSREQADVLRAVANEMGEAHLAIRVDKVICVREQDLTPFQQEVYTDWVAAWVGTGSLVGIRPSP